MARLLSAVVVVVSYAVVVVDLVVVAVAFLAGVVGLVFVRKQDQPLVTLFEITVLCFSGECRSLRINYDY